MPCAFTSGERVARALRDQRTKHTQEATDRDPWTLLAHALFNLKEFRFLR